jgi:ParB-like nuclease domain
MADEQNPQNDGEGKGGFSRAERPEPELVDIASLVRDEALQPRAALDEATVVEYLVAMQEGAKFPPVEVVETPDGDLLLVDGWRRVEAAERGEYTKLYARVWTGTRDEAIEFAAQRNAKHGLKRNEADLRKVVSMLIALPRWAQASNVKIAKHVGVSEWTIRHLRGDLEDEGTGAPAISDPAQTRVVHRRDQTYPIKVGRIGKAQERESEPATESDPAEPAARAKPDIKVDPSAKIMIDIRALAAGLNGEKLAALAAEWIKARIDVSLAIGAKPDVMAQLGGGVAARSSISAWLRSALDSQRVGVVNEAYGLIVHKDERQRAIDQIAGRAAVPVTYGANEVRRIMGSSQDEIMDLMSVGWASLNPASRRSLKLSWSWQDEGDSGDAAQALN